MVKGKEDREKDRGIRMKYIYDNLQSQMAFEDLLYLGF